MTRVAAVALILLSVAPPARALRVVVSPAGLGARAPRVAPVSAVVPRLAPRLGAAAAQSPRLGAVLPPLAPARAVSLAPAAPAAAPADAQRPFSRRGFSGAAALARAWEPIRRAEPGSPAAQGALAKIYTNGIGGSAALPVSAAGLSGARASSLAPAAPSLGHDRGELPEPGASFQSPREGTPSLGARLWSAVKTLGALGLGLYGGMQSGDLAYSFLLGGSGWAGLAGTTVALGTASFFLRRRAGAGQGSVLLPAFAASFGTAALGQLIADVSGWGLYALGAGALIGLAAGLYAAGLGARRT